MTRNKIERTNSKEVLFNDEKFFKNEKMLSYKVEMYDFSMKRSSKITTPEMNQLLGIIYPK